MSNLGRFYYVCLLRAYTSLFYIRMRMRTCERLLSNAGRNKYGIKNLLHLAWCLGIQ